MLCRCFVAIIMVDFFVSRIAALILVLRGSRGFIAAVPVRDGLR
jgi:hypothetical protein